MGFALLPRGLPGPRLERGPISDAMQPAPDRCGVADGRGLAGQNEEGGLECVLRVRLVTEYAAAHVEHHRAVPAEEGMESGRFSSLAEPPEEIPVGRLPHLRVFGGLEDHSEDRIGCSLTHRAAPLGSAATLTYIEGAEPAGS